MRDGSFLHSVPVDDVPHFDVLVGSWMFLASRSADFHPVAGDLLPFLVQDGDDVGSGAAADGELHEFERTAGGVAFVVHVEHLGMPALGNMLIGTPFLPWYFRLLGARIGKYGKDGKPRAMPGHNIPMAMLGTFILLFGWFGFNAASTFAATDVRFTVAALNTAIAGAFGSVACLFYITKRLGKPDPAMLAELAQVRAEAPLARRRTSEDYPFLLVCRRMQATTNSAPRIEGIVPTGYNPLWMNPADMARLRKGPVGTLAASRPVTSPRRPRSRRHPHEKGAVASRLLDRRDCSRTCLQR